MAEPPRGDAEVLVDPPLDGERAALLNGHRWAGDSAAADADAGGAPAGGSARARWAAALRHDAVVRAAAVNLGLILLWYALGTSLSLFNKKLLGREHGLFGRGAFPAPFAMSAAQFFAQHLIARGVLAAGCARRRRPPASAPMPWREYWRTVVPNGVATGLDIGFSNASLALISLSFYVMCKSTTPLFLLGFAIAWGVERASAALAGVVAVITAGLLLLVAGETRFSLPGFLLVMSAAALAGLRWTITQVLLQGPAAAGAGGGAGGAPAAGHGGGAAGGPVEVILTLTPVMGATVGAISLAHERLWATLPASPYFESAPHAALTAGIVAAGAGIAFAMVWAEFQVIANTSALTFMVAGVFKEIVTVGAAVLLLGEPFTPVNALGLLVLLTGVGLFNWLKYKRLRSGEARPLPLDGDGSAKADAELELGKSPAPSSPPAVAATGYAGGAPVHRRPALYSLEDDDAGDDAGGGGGGALGASSPRLSAPRHSPRARSHSPLGGEAP